MGLFRKLGRRVEEFKQEATAASDPDYECEACGARFQGNGEECPECGATAVVPLDEG